MVDQENNYNQQAESKKIGNEKIITLASISTYKIMPIGVIFSICHRSGDRWFLGVVKDGFYPDFYWDIYLIYYLWIT